jgi:hypothetical protein
MFKRLTWMGVGLVAGLGASKWVENKARRRLARYLPGGRLTLEAGAEVKDRARAVTTGTLSDLRYAVDEGRRAMADRQVELRRHLRTASPAPPRPSQSRPAQRRPLPPAPGGPRDV